MSHSVKSEALRPSPTRSPKSPKRDDLAASKSQAPRRAIEFQADPPISTQIQTLTRLISRLQSTLDLKDAKIDCEALAQSLKAVTERISDGFRKFLDDLWHCYRSAKRRSDDALIENALDLLNGQLPNVESLFDDLRKAQEQFMYDVVDSVKTGEQALFPCLNTVNEFIEALSRSFQETLWSDCESCLNHSDLGGYNAVRPTLLRRIARHHNELNALHFKLIDALYQLNDDDYSEEEKEENVDYEAEAIASIGEAVAASIKASRAAVFQVTKSYWMRDKFADEQADDEADDIQKRLVLIFDEDLGYIDQLVRKLGRIRDESDDEEHGAIDDPIVPFLKKEITLIYSDLLGGMKTMWACANKQDRRVETTQFGLLIVDLVKAQLQDRDEGSDLSAIAKLFQTAAMYHDDPTLKELSKILADQVNAMMSELDELRSQELHLIWEIPSHFDGEEGQPLDEIQIEENKEAIHKQYSSMSEMIDSKAFHITEALRLCQNAIFIYHKAHNDTASKTTTPTEGEQPKNEEEDGEQNGNDDFFEFAQSDVRFNETTHEHLANLNKFLTDIYELVITSQNETSDAGSVTSKKSAARKAARSKSARKKINASLTFDEKMQVEFTENSIVRTYEQLFASLRSLITVAIRNLDAESAEKLNQELKSQQVSYLGHLEDLRKACVDAMDIEGTKAAEARIATDQACNAEMIGKCLEDSLRDVVEQTIDNYWVNVHGIEDEQQVAEDMIRKNLDKRFGELERQEHMQALVLLEKQLKLELFREEQRTSPVVMDLEGTVKRLLNQREYEEAERQKRKLETVREKEREERKAQVEAKYAKLRKQKMDQQVRDLNNLEQSFNNKLDRIRQERDRQLIEQKKMLASSIRASQQRLVLFAARLTGTDNKARKDIAQRFERIVQTVLKEQSMSDLYATASK